MDVQHRDVARIKLCAIKEVQARERLSADVADEYAEAIREAGRWPFPPLSVVQDGARFIVWDGFHRLEAAHLAEVNTVPCAVTKGTLSDAKWLALSANRTHGLRRTNADKRRAVEEALRQRPHLSDSAIADHCGVTSKTVATHRKNLVNGAEIALFERRVGKDGKTHPATQPPREPLAVSEPVVVDDDPTDEPWRDEAEVMLRNLLGSLADELIQWARRAPREKVENVGLLLVKIKRV